MKENILVMENIRKVYSNGFIANENVNLAVNEGEIHALVGENGAGKSTLMKVLFGVEKLDEGRILLNGQEVHIDNPNVAIQLGIGMVYQHFMLVPSLTVTENLVIGMEPRKGGIFYDQSAAEKLVREAAQKYNFKLDPTAKIQDLPVGQKQKVEILKVLIRGAKIIILDEPTAVLTPQETRELFAELKGLKSQGYTVIFISHKLNEVTELCDRVTVMRAGKTIGVRNIADVTEGDISRMMVGRDIVLKIDKKRAVPGEEVLSVRHVTKYILNTKKILNAAAALPNFAMPCAPGGNPGCGRCGRKWPERDQRDHHWPRSGIRRRGSRDAGTGGCTGADNTAAAGEGCSPYFRGSYDLWNRGRRQH